MTGPEASSRRSKSSKRKAEDPDLEDLNASKRLKTPAAIPVYELDYMADDKETVGKDRDFPKETPAASQINEPEEACGRGHLVYGIVGAYVASRAMSGDKEIVGKDKDSANECRFRKDKESMDEFPATATIDEPVVSSNNAHPIYKTMCANMALDYYNSKNGTKFELVEDGTLDSYPFTDFSGSWIHCSFNAKEDSTIEQFFADIQYVYPSGPAVTTCKTLQGETKVGCENCHSAVIHPVSGYWRGFHDNTIDASRAMSNKEDRKLIVENDDDTICKTPAATPIIEPEVACSETFLIYKTSIANMALAYYNNKYGTKFALLQDETLESYMFPSFATHWIHCCFNAKDDSSINKFFAEIELVFPADLAVTTCMILEGETKLGCRNCPPAITHPISGFQGGLEYHYEIPDPPTYTPPPPEPFGMQNLLEDCRKKAYKGVSNRALDHYNNINGTKFVVVDDENICCSAFSESWIHCCFNAVDSSIQQLSAGDSSIKQFKPDDSPIKLFFAEIKYYKFSDPVVTNCKIVEGKTKVGCENCNSVTHPVDGYRGSLLADTEIVEERDDKYPCYYHRTYADEFIAAQIEKLSDN